MSSIITLIDSLTPSEIAAINAAMALHVNTRDTVAEIAALYSARIATVVVAELGMVS